MIEQDCPSELFKRVETSWRKGVPVTEAWPRIGVAGRLGYLFERNLFSLTIDYLLDNPDEYPEGSPDPRLRARSGPALVWLFGLLGAYPPGPSRTR